MTWGLRVGVSGAGGEAECGGWHGGSFPGGWWPPSASPCCLLGLGWELEGTRGGLGLKLPAKHLDEENQDAEILQNPFFVIFLSFYPCSSPSTLFTHLSPPSSVAEPSWASASGCQWTGSPL